MGGKGAFARVGNTGVAEARRLIDLCIDHGVNLIDTADVYSAGASEEIIGEALGGRRKGSVLMKALAIADRDRHQAWTARHRLGPADLALLGPYLA